MKQVVDNCVYSCGTPGKDFRKLARLFVKRSFDGFLSLLVAGWLLAACAIAGSALAGQLDCGEVTATFDGRPFRYEITNKAVRPNYVIYHLQYPSPLETPVPQNNTIPAELFVPANWREGDPGRPTVICLHILSGETALMELTCSALASHGLCSIMFRLPYYGERSLPGGPRAIVRNPQLFTEAVKQAWLDIRRTVDLLSARPEVNRNRIGLIGISFGAIVGLSAAGEEPRIWRIMPILAGGDLLQIIRHARETRPLTAMLQEMTEENRAEVEALIASVDPLRYAGALRQRAAAGRVFMVNAAEDEVIPRECTEKLARELGISDQVFWLEGLGHYSSMAALPRIVDRMIAFFQQDLPEDLRQRPADRVITPVGALSTILQQASAMIATEPQVGRGHLVELAGWAKPRNASTREKIDFRIRFARGNGGQFRLEAQLPAVGSVAIGQSQSPWLVAANGTVFCGEGIQGGANFEDEQSKEKTKIAAETRNPLRFVDPRVILQLRMGAGALTVVSLAPEVLEKIGVEAREEGTSERPALRIVSKERVVGEMMIHLRPGTSTPERLHLLVEDWEAEIQIFAWEVNTPVPLELFESPDAEHCRKVPCEDLHRIFGAFVNFVAQSVEL